MKKIVSVILCFLMLLCFIGCETDKPAVTTQAEVTVTPQSDTASLTTDEITAAKPEPTREEARLLIEAAAEKGILSVGGWVTPSRDLLDENYDAYVNALKACKEAGFTYLHTLDEGWSTGWLSKYFTAANDAKLCTSLFLGYHGSVDDEQIESGSQIFDWFYSAPGVFSINLYDEPSNSEATLKKLGEYAAEIRKLSSSLPVAANLFPVYAYNTLDVYNKYLSDYCNYVKPDYMSFDYYPYTAKTTSSSELSGYMQNLAMIKIYADKLNIPVHTFIQSSNRTTVSAEMLSLLVNVSVASGADNIIYYTLFPYSDGKGVLNADGSETELYERVKSVNNTVHGMQGVYLSFKCDGIMTVGEKSIDRSIVKGEQATGGKFLLSSHGAISSVEASQALVGCYTKGTQTGYYVVNTSMTDTQKITLRLNGEHSYQLWGNGLEKFGSSDFVEVELPASSAKFVIVDADNSTDREEFKMNDVFATLTEKKSGTILDISVKDSKLVNNVTDGVKLVARSWEPTADGGIKNYKIRTETLSNTAAGIITVECDIKITDDGYVDVFRDIYDNFNLLRYDNFWFGVYGGADYHDGNTGLNIDTALPKNKKLHIEIVECDGMQSLTINGELLVSGSKSYTASHISSFLFDGTRSNITLYSAKISVAEW